MLLINPLLMLLTPLFLSLLAVLLLDQIIDHHSLHKMLPEALLSLFDGTSNLDVFDTKFEICNKHFDLTETECFSIPLGNSIRDQAIWVSVLWWSSHHFRLLHEMMRPGTENKNNPLKQQQPTTKQANRQTNKPAKKWTGNRRLRTCQNLLICMCNWNEFLISSPISYILSFWTLL